MKIVYEDKDVIVIRKPSGVATQSAGIAAKDCVSYIKEHLSKEGGYRGREPYVGVVHRLDQPVAGLLVFAKNEKAAAILSNQVQTDDMTKHYVAIVEGLLSNTDETQLVNYIYKDSKNNKAVITKESKNKGNIKIQKAILNYCALQDEIDIVKGKPENSSVLGINLKTGRFHQIRAQLSGMGHPILGDKKYGAITECPVDFAHGQGMNRGAIALVADRLEFLHPVTREKMKFIFNEQ